MQRTLHDTDVGDHGHGRSSVLASCNIARRRGLHGHFDSGVVELCLCVQAVDNIDPVRLTVIKSLTTDQSGAPLTNAGSNGGSTNDSRTWNDAVYLQVLRISETPSRSDATLITVLMSQTSSSAHACASLTTAAASLGHEQIRVDVHALRMRMQPSSPCYL